MELALVALVLRLLAVLDAMTLDSAVETLVVSRQCIPFAFAFLLLIPQESANIFFGPWPNPDLCRFNLVEGFAGTSFLPCACVHAVCFQVGANFFYGSECGVVVVGASARGEELVVDTRMYVVFQIPDGSTIVGFGVVL